MTNVCALRRPNSPRKPLAHGCHQYKYTDVPLKQPSKVWKNPKTRVPVVVGVQNFVCRTPCANCVNNIPTIRMIFTCSVQ